MHLRAPEPASPSSYSQLSVGTVLRQHQQRQSPIWPTRTLANCVLVSGDQCSYKDQGPHEHGNNYCSRRLPLCGSC